MYINIKNYLIKDIKLFNYQQEAKNKTDVKTTICNWSRGLGKNYTLASIILSERPKNVLYIGKASENMKSLSMSFNDVFDQNTDTKRSIDSLNVTKDKIIIKYFDDIQTTIFDYAYLPNESYQNIFFDYVMFNDLLPIPIDYKCRRIISMVTVNNHDRKLEQLFKHNTAILNEDYSAGIKNGLFNLNSIEKLKNNKYWYDEYAILDDKKQWLTENIFIILNILHNEMNRLASEIQKAKENEEYGACKNLILEYKKVSLLVYDIHKQLINN